MLEFLIDVQSNFNQIIKPRFKGEIHNEDVGRRYLEIKAVIETAFLISLMSSLAKKANDERNGSISFYK